MILTLTLGQDLESQLVAKMGRISRPLGGKEEQVVSNVNQTSLVTMSTAKSQEGQTHAVYGEIQHLVDMVKQDVINVQYLVYLGLA
jgi:hypothetical protein